MQRFIRVILVVFAVLTTMAAQAGGFQPVSLVPPTNIPHHIKALEPGQLPHEVSLPSDRYEVLLVPVQDINLSSGTVVHEFWHRYELRVTPTSTSHVLWKKVNFYAPVHRVNDATTWCPDDSACKTVVATDQGIFELDSHHAYHSPAAIEVANDEVFQLVVHMGSLVAATRWGFYVNYGFGGVFYLPKAWQTTDSIPRLTIRPLSEDIVFEEHLNTPTVDGYQALTFSQSSPGFYDLVTDSTYPLGDFINSHRYPGVVYWRGVDAQFHYSEDGGDDPTTYKDPFPENIYVWGMSMSWRGEPLNLWTRNTVIQGDPYKGWEAYYLKDLLIKGKSSDTDETIAGVVPALWGSIVIGNQGTALRLPPYNF